jgi:2,3-diaminopropionate biosynthesis protein SbnB
MLIVGRSAVRRILDGADPEVLRVVERAYRLHEQGRTSVPHSVFLRFPDGGFPDAARSRIIGLPAYVASDPPAAGLKWISSFPANITRGVERASAAIVLNSLATGQPTALVEGSVISARRTAASAALAADLLTRHHRPDGLSLIGCGLINAQVLRFVAGAVPLPSLAVFDLDEARAEAFAEKASRLLPDTPVAVVPTAEKALAAHRLTSLATTAATPHLSLASCPPDAVVLHLSLRDLEPGDLLGAYNVVDDADHACRELTSLHLAQRLTGGRDFIHGTVGGPGPRPPPPPPPPPPGGV